MAHYSGMIRELRKMRKQLQPPSEELLVLHFSKSGDVVTITWNEYHEAERSSLVSNSPNELAKQFRQRFLDGDIDDGGLMAFFVDTSDLWGGELT